MMYKYALAATAIVSTSAAPSIYREADGACTQLDTAQFVKPPVWYTKPAESPNGCDIWKIVGCGAAASAAAAACGELGPGDVACIMAALAGISGCGPCLCSTVGCPSWCPCDMDSQPEPTAASFKLGTCSAAGFPRVSGATQVANYMGETRNATATVYRATASADDSSEQRRHHGNTLEKAMHKVDELHHEFEKLEHHEHHGHGHHGDEHKLLEDASFTIDELHHEIEKLEEHEHHRHRGEVVAAAAPTKALRGAARIPSFIKDPANGSTCSSKGTCGNAYQACCIAFQLKGFPCGCHLKDGTGQVGANCGDCGTTFGVCCVAESCKCDIA